MYIIWIILILLYLITNIILTMAVMATETTANKHMRIIMVICCVIAGLPMLCISLIFGFVGGIMEVVRSGIQERRDGNGLY